MVCLPTATDRSLRPVCSEVEINDNDRFPLKSNTFAETRAMVYRTGNNRFEREFVLFFCILKRLKCVLWSVSNTCEVVVTVTTIVHTGLDSDFEPGEIVRVIRLTLNTLFWLMIFGAKRQSSLCLLFYSNTSAGCRRLTSWLLLFATTFRAIIPSHLSRCNKTFLDESHTARKLPALRPLFAERYTLLSFVYVRRNYPRLSCAPSVSNGRN